MKLARWFAPEESPPDENLAAPQAKATPPAPAPDDSVDVVYLYEGRELKRTRIEVSGLLTQLENDVALTLQLIRDTSQEARDRVEESIQLSGQIQVSSRGLSSLSASARKTSDRLVETARQMESSNLEIERQVTDSDEVIEEARNLAGTVSQQMRALSEAARNIASVVDVIRTIARQTNLLALNATIEAARAGAAGRGFSVVATEVKTLASQVQTATADISRQIAVLEGAVKSSGATMTRMADLIGKVDPVLESIRAAAVVQVHSTRDVASRAVGTADFADVVAQSAEAMHELAKSATAVAEHAGDATRTMDLTLERLNHRSMIYFRQAITDERRETDRIPIYRTGSFRTTTKQVEITVVDLSQSGAMIMRNPDAPDVGSRGILRLDGIGECAATILDASEFGVHLSFSEPSQAMCESIDAHIAKSREESAAWSAIMNEAAAELASVFEDGVSTGQVQLDHLVRSRYTPIPGSYPVQYETAALPFYERTIPDIIERYRRKIPDAIFVLAYDRNSYLPVHSPEYSLPQIKNDIGWNELNARNKRIMPRAQTLRAARNTDPDYVSLYVRDMKDGSKIYAKLVAAPVFVRKQLWGNIMFAKAMA